MQKVGSKGMSLENISKNVHSKCYLCKHHKFLHNNEGCTVKNCECPADPKCDCENCEGNFS